MSKRPPGFRLAVLLAADLLAPPSLAFGQDAIFADTFETIALVATFGGDVPPPVDLAFIARIDVVDAYVIIDRSGSMSTEIATVKNNLAGAVFQLACEPVGSGIPPACIPDLWVGAGAVGYALSGSDAYRNSNDVQLFPNLASLPITEPATGCCAEPLVFSVYAAITGNGGTDYGFNGVAARASCATSPAANGGFATFGYPCFRQGALPLVLLATDEQPLSAGDTSKVPDWTTIVLPQMLARGARFIGITGSGFAVNTDVDLRKMASDTGAVDAANADAPFVFDGGGANAATAIKNGILSAAQGVPLRVRALVEDDAADAVDAVAAFVDRIETHALGTEACADGLAVDDSNADGHDDRYSHVIPGTGLCWRLVPKANGSVPPTDEWQRFRATVRVVADVDMPLDSRQIVFLVPPPG